MSPPKKRSKRVRSTSSSSSSSNRDASRTIPRHKRHRHAKSQRNKNVSDNISSYQSYNAYFNPNITLSNIIPEFDPKSIDIDDWLDILQHNAQIHKWSENFIVYQALNKLKGTAKAWYDSYIENEMGWSKLTWAQWMLILKNTFKTNRNAYKLLTDITNHKPTEGCSLYDFHFAHLAKINKLRLNFTDADKVSLVIGAINDSNISTAVEASTITDPNVLGVYLKNKIYCKNKEISQGPSRNVFNQKCYTSSNNNFKNYVSKPIHYELNCVVCGYIGHDRTTCPHRKQTCNFCHTKGHIERSCLSKLRHHKSNNVKNSKYTSITKQSRNERVNLIKHTEASSKFYKQISLNNQSILAFIDFGSECSLIKSTIAHNFCLERKLLQNNITTV
ncbi:hypothetical protein RN001_002453 [Aquatica leii]|uniref:CCHC-type domain-containing protein n=1 Tax=Aquatica leii TaxID=1421715 RepID=A0AAN7PH01_9COLE|nr:hypothetical protein RN001_002453 [Aquatica leii]